MDGVKVTHLILTLIMISKEAMEGSSQTFDFFLKNQDGIICPNETVEYTCRSDTGLLQFIAEPFFNSSGSSAYIAFNNAALLGIPVHRANGSITVMQVSNNPNIIAVTIRGDFTSTSLSLTCRAGIRNSTLEFSESGGPPPVRMQTLEPVDADCDDNRRGIFVDFDPSPGLDIAAYIVNCSENNCAAISLSSEQTDVNVSVSSSEINRQFTVGVTAVDRCGFESPIVTKEILLETIPCPVCNIACILAIFFGVLAATLLILLIMTLVYFIRKNCQKNEPVEAVSKEPIEMTKEITKEI